MADSPLKGKSRKMVAFMAKTVKIKKKDVMRNFYIKVFEHIVEKFKFQEKLGIQKTEDDRIVIVQGSKGAGSIKIVTAEKDKRKLYSIPAPSQASILDCYNFFASETNCFKDKSVKGFVSKNGVFYPAIENLDSVGEIKSAADKATGSGTKDKEAPDSPVDNK